MTINKERPGLILFDVYETLIDMRDLEKKVNQLFNQRYAYTIWYNLFMEYCFVDNCIDQFNDFPAIARATLQMTGKMIDKEISEQSIGQVLDLLKHLPLQPDVQEGLSILNDEGFEMVALTNSPEKIVVERMERTGLISYFNKVMSAERLGKYKPFIEVYNWAVREMKGEPGNTLMVSAHGWDIAGAANAGLQTAHIIQSNQVLYPLAPQPDHTFKSISELGRYFKSSQTTNDRDY
ncbi:haloacid dehalogenase type II [Pseudoflavitalea rhizosphaerae]|uniref:haloacid dehalogenase type II n=1 Tax=Pseudoflavitalea rhizosphaerae TaxID=1884793 RepID=UPI000F8F77A4|nr:haloacid dehalogenase type II [Pseudoflavitalea rhizosphaerae]